jgi:lipoyl(octanoyl) transferase
MFRFLGRLSYAAGLEAQAAAAAEVERGSQGLILGLTHEPVITLGRHAKTANVLVDEGVLAARGIALARTDRGGDVTYHGPEQAIVYPIARLGSLGVKAFVRILERAMIDYLGALGLIAIARDDAPGVYVSGRKIGLLGLRVQRGITRHGLALNLGGSLEAFSLIHPCGHAGQALTSVEALTGTRPTHEAAARAMSERIEAALAGHF